MKRYLGENDRYERFLVGANDPRASQHTVDGSQPVGDSGRDCDAVVNDRQRLRDTLLGLPGQHRGIHCLRCFKHSVQRADLRRQAQTLALA